jgi:preprotein translocase subunit SecE
VTEKQELIKSKPNKARTTKSGTGANKLKWLIIVLLVVAMVVANVYFSEIATAIRAAGFIVIAAVLLFFAKTTTQGELAWGFIKDSRIEMRKVVWPTRKETVNTTMIIVAVVLVAALILWLFDSLFMYLVRTILSI